MGVRSKMRKASVVAILLVLLVSLFLLSVLSNILTGYPESSHLPDSEPEKEQTEKDKEKEPAVLLFKVSPVTPQLYWRVFTADYYTGLNWLRTTDEKILEEAPQVRDANATEVFTVELSTHQHEIFLPLPPPNPTLVNLSSAPIDGLKLYVDTLGGAYKAAEHGPANVTLVYDVSWRDVEVDDRLISLDDIPEVILDKYRQLPDIPIEVQKLAEGLEDPSYSILDQVLADVQYFRTNFVYDIGHSHHVYNYATQGSDVSSYVRQKKGVCKDAATALAVILRIQEIPSRVSIGYKPGGMKGGKLLYYTSGAHAVTEVYLPPYGWIQFDATPPLEENPLVKVSPFKKESSPGSRVFCQLSITNRYEFADYFKLFVDSKQEWNVEAAPEELRLEAHQTSNALLEVTIPHDAEYGEKDVVTVTAVSVGRREVAFSIVAVVQVANIFHVPTTVSVTDVNEAVIRGDTFWANGTVLTTNDKQCDNMTIFVFLTKSSEAEGAIIGNGYSEQGNFQIKNTVPYFLEIGDYKVILISLGTTRYASSSGEYIIRVCSTTRIELGSEEEFLLGYGAIHGRLLWDNGTGLAKAPISLNITSLARPSEGRKSQNLTSDDGGFRISPTFEDPGVYEVKATFSGSKHVLGSSATNVLELKRGIPTIRIFGENTAIRGEVFNITGTIQFEDIPVWGETIAVAFDGRLLTTVETRDNGSYTWSFALDREEKLGPHFFTIALEKGNVSAFHEVQVRSKTELTTTVSEVAEGLFLLFSASLSDDHDQPIPGAEIVLDNYGVSWKTDKNGNSTFLLDTVELWPENLVLTASFQGSESYLPVTTEKEVVLEPVISLPFLIPLAFSILVVLSSLYAEHHAQKQRIFQQTSAIEVAEKRVVVAKEHVYKPQRPHPFRIILLDIDPQFPNVWGVNDKLRMEIVVEHSVLEKMLKREVEVFIDEESVTSLRLSRQGRAGLSHIFTKKGEHKIRARLLRLSESQPWHAEIKLRVVDYREEIIRLYNKFLEDVASYDISTPSQMTAREIQSLFLRTSDLNPEALHNVTTYFEKAEYSSHPSTRKDYEVTYLSRKKLNKDVEHEE